MTRTWILACLWGTTILTSTLTTERSYADTFRYDGAGRLRSAVSSDGAELLFQYDALGNLARVCAPDGCREVVVDDAISPARVVAERGPGGTDALFVYGSSRLLAVRRDGEVRYALTDELGSVVALTNRGGAIVGRVSFDPYGRVRAQEGEASPIGFGGEYASPGGEWVWLRHRMYSTSEHRFAARDSYPGGTRSPASLNRYSYVEGDPLGHVDPSGHQPEPPGRRPRGYLLDQVLDALRPRLDPAMYDARALHRVARRHLDLRHGQLNIALYDVVTARESCDASMDPAARVAGLYRLDQLNALAREEGLSRPLSVQDLAAIDHYLQVRAVPAAALASRPYDFLKRNDTFWWAAQQSPAFVKLLGSIHMKPPTELTSYRDLTTSALETLAFEESIYDFAF